MRSAERQKRRIHLHSSYYFAVAWLGKAWVVKDKRQKGKRQKAKRRKGRKGNKGKKMDPSIRFAPFRMTRLQGRGTAPRVASDGSFNPLRSFQDDKALGPGDRTKSLVRCPYVAGLDDRRGAGRQTRGRTTDAGPDDRRGAGLQTRGRTTDAGPDDRRRGRLTNAGRRYIYTAPNTG